MDPNNNGDTEDEEYGGESSSAEKGTSESSTMNKKGPSAGIRTARSGAGGLAASACCQAERCGADLSEAKRYHRRHKVCELHSKAPVVPVAGLRQRFCQQCSRFHELSEFDEAKRSCRRRLAGHNERRRKSSVECYGESSAAKITYNSKETTHNNGDHANFDPRPKFQTALQGNSHYNKQYNIR